MSDMKDVDLTEEGSGIRFSKVPVEVSIVVGHARPSIRELFSMGEAAVLELDRTIDDPVELYIGERLIALGELEELDGEGSGRLGVRIIEVVDNDRLDQE